MFRADLRAVQETFRTGVVESTATAADKWWNTWMAFCRDHAVDPWFPDDIDPIPYLQVFGQRYRDGRLAPRGQPVRSDTVAKVLRYIGQGYLRVGARDIRLDNSGRVDFRLSRQLRSYTKADPQRSASNQFPSKWCGHWLTPSVLSTWILSTMEYKRWPI